MSISLIQLINKYDLQNCNVIRDRPFDMFARATTVIEGKKCVYIADEKYIKELDVSVAMIITNEEISKEINDKFGVCVCDNPRGTFFELMSYYEKEQGRKEEKTTIGKNCKISKNAVIAAENVTIGDNVIIEDFVVIHPNTYIGDNVTIQSGARIAEQDFNVYEYGGRMKQIHHSGRVIIGSNSLISANVVIGQAMYSYGKTVIGESCFIGASTCVGHNSEIGNRCEICANSILGGYCKVGDNSKLFMSVTVSNSTSIGENVIINMGSVVIRDVPHDKTMFGNPAREIIKPK